MTLAFTAQEILEIARKIELNGAAFYRRAAEIATDPTTKGKLLELASWEAAHESTIVALQEQLTGAERAPAPLDPDDETLLYLNAMAARHVLGPGRSLEQVFHGTETVDEVLDIAVGFERDSIVLFQGLEGLVSDAAGKERVRSLVAEEMEHVAFLTREKQRLLGA